MPKSASTSLAATLSSLHGIDFEQLIFPGLESCKDFRLLADFHSDIRHHTKGLLDTYVESRLLFKQHIPPTIRHLGYLRSRSKVILLRDPSEVIDAYCRAEEKGIHPPRPQFRGINGTQAWNKRAKDIGLLEELERFFLGWSQQQDNHTLRILHSDLVTDPKKVINQVEEFLGLAPSCGPVVLARKRYSQKADLLHPWTKLRLSACAASRAFANTWKTCALGTD